MNKHVDWSKWDSREIIFDNRRGECRNCGHGEYWHLENRPSCKYKDYECKAQQISVLEVLVPRKKIVSIMCPCIRYIYIWG